jgi:hypothetical protein
LVGNLQLEFSHRRGGGGATGAPNRSSGGADTLVTGEDKVPKIAIRLLAAIVALLSRPFKPGQPERQKSRLAWKPDAMRVVVPEARPAFEKSSGHKLVIEYDYCRES